MQLFDELNQDIDLFLHNHNDYARKVDALSDLFKLKNNHKLHSDYLPLYFLGNYEQLDDIPCIIFTWQLTSPRNNLNYEDKRNIAKLIKTLNNNKEITWQNQNPPLTN